MRSILGNIKRSVISFLFGDYQRTYSQLGEDLIIRHIFNALKVEHPLKISVQFLKDDAMQLRGEIINYMKQNFPFIKKKKSTGKAYEPQEYFLILQEWLYKRNAQSPGEFLSK